MYHKTEASARDNTGNSQIDKNPVKDRSSLNATSGGSLGLCCMLLLGFVVTSLGGVAAVYSLVTQLRDLLVLGVTLICMGGICLIIALIQLCRKYRANTRIRTVFPQNTEDKDVNKTSPDYIGYTTSLKPPVKSILRETEPKGITPTAEECEYPMNGNTLIAEDGYTIPGVSDDKDQHSSLIDYSKLYTLSNMETEKLKVVLPADASVGDIGYHNAVYTLPIINEESSPNR